MPVNREAYEQINAEIRNSNVTLIAVSKTKPVSDILKLYNLGQKDFGENYVQELTEKQSQLPNDIRWHFIGHLQTNKVKVISSFVHLIHGVDSFRLLKEINKQAEKNNRVIDCLLQIHIAQEETKFGFDENELNDLFVNQKAEIENLKNVRITGLMGMASFTESKDVIKSEFRYLKSIFEKYRTSSIRNLHFSTLSMGMSGDYKTAIQEGSNMVRIGSLLFGAREYQK
ncbi:MAG: YggS family pyridoxal phosphate-dependent enzyme [Chitinophagaceae bacterium]